MLNEMGINVVENEDADDDGEEKARPTTTTTRTTAASWSRPSAKSLATAEKKEPSERTDDPVRMYLREMGSVELLSREGEIAIAKRIEAGREAMIAGLCESPLTFQAIIIWRDELNEGKVFLRDIIDLEATYAGPDAKNVQPPQIDPATGLPIPQQPDCRNGGRRAQFRSRCRPAAASARRAAAPARRPARRRPTRPRRQPRPAPRPATRSRRIPASPPPRAITTKTTWRIRCRSPRSRPSSSRR